MPGKTNEGFTKAAQKNKFVRNRDINLKGSEVKKEEHIQRVMCEGICSRCREKVQWRFRYDKYKSLKTPATCQDCKGKTINKAYRTICDNCSKKRGVCAGCCISFEEDAARRAVVEAAAAAAAAAATAAGGSAAAIEGESIIISDHKQPTQLVEGAEKRSSAAMDLDSEDGDDDQEADDDQQTTSAATEKVADAAVAGDDVATASDPALKQGLELASAWDERKFQNIAALKYGKHRSVGADDDTVFNFGGQNT